MTGQESTTSVGTEPPQAHDDVGGAPGIIAALFLAAIVAAALLGITRAIITDRNGRHQRRDRGSPSE